MFARFHFVSALLGTAILLLAGCATSPPPQRSAPPGASLKLEVQEGTPAISGQWSAHLSRELENGQIWFLTTVTVNGKSTSFPITIPVVNFPLMFDINSWPAQTGLSNDVGQILFRGKRHNGEAVGTFVFAPNPVYLRACEVLRAKPSLTELFQMAFYEVRAEELIGYAGSGLAVSATELCGLKALGVKASYVKALCQAGDFSIDDVKRLHSFGVPEAYVSQLLGARCVSTSQELAQLYRYGLTTSEVMAWKWSGCGFDAYAISRLHAKGIAPRFGALVAAIAETPKEEELTRLKDYGLTEAYLGAMQKAKLRCSQEELTQLFTYGVDADYYSAWHASGYDFDPATIVQLHRGKVSSKLAEPLKKSGFKVGDFLRLQTRGVPADYILEWQKSGFQLSADDFIRLYIAGVPSSYAAGLMGTAVPTDDILRLYQKGFSARDIREINGGYSDPNGPSGAGK